MVETNNVLQNRLCLLGEALEAIPDTEKLAYLKALERAPLVVKRETDPIAFLRCEDYDVWAAALSLV
jgi:hypothetical protein